MRYVVACTALLAAAGLGGCGGADLSDAGRAFVESAADVRQEFRQEYGAAAPQALARGASGVIDTDRYRQAINDLQEKGQLTTEERDRRHSLLFAAYNEFKQGKITRQQFEQKAQSLQAPSEAPPTAASTVSDGKPASASAVIVSSASPTAQPAKPVTQGILKRSREWEDNRPKIADFNPRTGAIQRVITEEFETGSIDELSATFADRSGRNRTLKLVQITRAFREVARASGSEEHTLSIQATLYIDGQQTKGVAFGEQQQTYTIEAPGLLVTVAGDKVSWVAQ